MGMTNYHIGPHATASGHFRPHGITWDYHNRLSEIIRPNLFKQNVIVTDSNNNVSLFLLNDKFFCFFFKCSVSFLVLLKRHRQKTAKNILKLH